MASAKLPNRPGFALLPVHAIHSPDPPILAFFVFLASFVLHFSLRFCAFLLSFPKRFARIRRFARICELIRANRAI